MRFNSIVISQILFTTIVGHSAWAQSTYDITQGTYEWTTNIVVNGVEGWPGSGLRANGELTALINSSGNIDVSNNHSGLFFSENASVTIHHSETDKLFSANNNGWDGILVESNADLTVKGMSISANGNTENGIRANSGGQIAITETTTVEFNNNGDKGLFAFSDNSIISIFGNNDNASYLYVKDNNQAGNWGAGIWSENNALVNIANMNMEVTGNGLAGVMLRSGGQMAFSGDGRQYLHVTENGSGRDGGVIVYGNSSLNITGMDIQLNNNGNYGLQVADGSTAYIISNDDIQNSITANGNKNSANSWTEGTGFAAQGASKLVIQNMNVSANGNGRYGLSATDGGVISVEGNGRTILEVLQNVTSQDNPWAIGAGIVAKGINSAYQELVSTINIIGMNLKVEGNDYYGIRATEGGAVNIAGTYDNHLNIAKNNSADGNMGHGIVADQSSSAGTRSTINIVDMNIRVEDQAYQGIAARDGGLLNISSTQGTHTLDVYNTRMATDRGQDLGKGIHAKGADSVSKQVATIVITDMDIIANDNELEGVVAANSGVIQIESTSGNNTLTANENRRYAADTPDDWSYGAGLLAHGVSADTVESQAAIMIKNMNVEANDNGLYGLYARDGGMISITGDGSHTLDLIGNKSTADDTYDAGIAIEGLIAGATSEKPAAIAIKNMEITIKDNGGYGIDVASGGQMSVSSDSGNTLTISGNQKGDTGNNAGVGINVNGVFDGVRSQLAIVDMDVLVDGSPDAGVKVADGGLINIVSNRGNNLLKSNGNDNHGTQYNEGAGLFAVDSESTANEVATLNVVGMNIEAKNNGSYGVIAEGGDINIQGNGSHTLDVDGNGRYGLLAKDGGSMLISGMQVSGNSSEHSLVGIERNGLIYLTNSTIATDNNALFYTWSDSDTQKSQYILDNAVAIGNGQMLANFTAANNTLDATHSRLVNAIVTDHTSAASSKMTLERSVWEMKADSNITDLIASNSYLDLRGATNFNTLTVDNSYKSENSTLEINTQLGNDSSPTDRLVVRGDTSGTTTVVVNNAGGSGAQTLNGIEVIEVGGRSEGEFVQSGRIVAGSYEYVLGRGNGTNSSQSNWYLTNSVSPAEPDGPSVYRPEMGSYLANLMAANTLFNLRLHDRVGDTQYTDLLTGEEKVTSLWLRQVGGHTRFDTAQQQLHTQTNRYIAQIGGDIAQWSQDGLDRWHLGVMAGYGNSQSNTESNVSHYRSRGHVTGYSLGLYGTWYANEEDKSGSYLDSWVMYNWFKNTVSGQELVSEKYDSDGFTASVEGGYSFLLGHRKDGRSTYWLQPKAQVTWMGVQADTHTEANGTRVKGKSGDHLQTRLGIRTYIKGHNAIDDGKMREFQPFVEANWIYNSHHYGVTLNNVNGYQEGTRHIGEVKVGVEGQLNNHLHLWGNVAQQLGDKGYSDTQGMLGIKYTFR